NPEHPAVARQSNAQGDDALELLTSRCEGIVDAPGQIARERFADVAAEQAALLGWRNARLGLNDRVRSRSGSSAARLSAEHSSRLPGRMGPATPPGSLGTRQNLRGRGRLFGARRSGRLLFGFDGGRLGSPL